MKNKESKESMVSQAAVSDHETEERGLRGSDEHHESTWALTREPTEGGDSNDTHADDPSEPPPPSYQASWNQGCSKTTKKSKRFLQYFECNCSYKVELRVLKSRCPLQIYLEALSLMSKGATNHN